MKTLDAKVIISRFRDGGESFAVIAKGFRLTADALRSRVKKAEPALYKAALNGKSKNGRKLTDWRKGETVTVKKPKAKPKAKPKTAKRNAKVWDGKGTAPSARGFCRFHAAKGKTEDELLKLLARAFPDKTSPRSEVKLALNGG